MFEGDDIQAARFIRNWWQECGLELALLGLVLCHSHISLTLEQAPGFPSILLALFPRLARIPQSVSFSPTPGHLILSFSICILGVCAAPVWGAPVHHQPWQHPGLCTHQPRMQRLMGRKGFSQRELGEKELQNVGFPVGRREGECGQHSSWPS